MAIPVMGNLEMHARADVCLLTARREQLAGILPTLAGGWTAFDDLRILPAPIALRAIFRWVPVPLAVHYWAQLLASPKGEYYFGRHARHAAREMAALAADVLALAPSAPMPHWRRLEAAIAAAAAGAQE